MQTIVSFNASRGGPEDFRVVAGEHNLKQDSGLEQIIYIDKIIKVGPNNEHLHQKKQPI